MYPNHHHPGGSQIQPNPRISGHRRAQSETFYRLSEEFLLDLDPDFNLPEIDFPSFSDGNIESGEILDLSTGGAHLRSLSVDAVEKKPQHRHSSSMDGATSLFEGECSKWQSDYARKAMDADKLAELALIDPKRAKRILANRQSAARSKDRKIRYTSELERKVQTLQTEATTLSAQFTQLQRDTTGLTTENRELKLRLQYMEQQANLRDALNEALKEDVQRLKIATGQIPKVNGNPFNRGNQVGHQAQQLLHSDPISNNRAHPHNSSQSQMSSNSLAFNDRSAGHDSMDIM